MYLDDSAYDIVLLKMNDDNHNGTPLRLTPTDELKRLIMQSELKFLL